MKYYLNFTRLFIIGLLLIVLTIELRAQESQKKDPVEFAERNLGGPRLGFTFIADKGKLFDRLKDEGIDRLISQFGWHFEWQIKPKGGGPSFIIEMIPLVGGVEYGKIIPSATLAMGVRLPNGIEFGMGPNILAGKDKIYSALMLAVGKSINYSGVSIPLNLVYTFNPEGKRISFVFGYSIAN